MRFTALAATLLMIPTTSSGGMYTDDLSRCLVESSSKEDRASLVRWMFAAASAHPAVQPIVSVPKDAIEGANRGMGNLMMKLLTESCQEKAQKAISYEGPAALQMSFQVLGQVAGAELFGSPEVKATMGDLEKHLDKEKLDALGKPPQGK